MRMDVFVEYNILSVLNSFESPLWSDLLGSNLFVNSIDGRLCTG